MQYNVRYIWKLGALAAWKKKKKMKGKLKNLTEVIFDH